MRKYNTKKEEYKEWLKLKELESKIPFSFEKTKEESDIEKLLRNPKYLKYIRFYNNPPKWYVSTFHKSDRLYNKQALKVNIKMMGNDYDEHPMDEDEDWVGELKGWESEYINYRYKHRNTAKWWYW